MMYSKIFAAMATSLPFLNSYMNTGGDFRHGVNFVVAGRAAPEMLRAPSEILYGPIYLKIKLHVMNTNKFILLYKNIQIFYYNSLKLTIIHFKSTLLAFLDEKSTIKLLQSICSNMSFNKYHRQSIQYFS